MENAKQQLKNTFTEYWKYLALNAACELELFDKIKQGEDTIQSISAKNNWDKKGLEDLIGFCLEENYLRSNSNGVLINTEKGNLLRKDNPDGLYFACLHWADEHMNAWQNLSYTIRTGKPSFERIYKKPFFDFLNTDKEKLSNYQKAMHEYARDDYSNFSYKVDFSDFSSIMDIGGSRGALIQNIKGNNPLKKCYLFDTPEVLHDINIEGINLIPGNFFEGIPSVSEVLILSRVLHDWDDEAAIRILNNCNSALPENGTVLIIEILTDRIRRIPYLLNLNMKSICKSRERSKEEFETLLEKTGFKIVDIKKLNDLQSIIIAKK